MIQGCNKVRRFSSKKITKPFLNIQKVTFCETKGPLRS